MLNRNSLFTFIFGIMIGVIVGVGGLTLTRRVQPAPIVIQPPPPTAPPLPTATPGPLRVFVNGAVTAPGVYETPPTAIVQQAIELAGGFTAAADTAVVNLALPLQDGLQIYVPTTDETAQQTPPVITGPVSRTAGLELEAAEGNENTGQLVNINNAGLAELDTLPGIGPSTAEKIVEYRETNGPFATIEEIMSVSGIGPAKFEQIKAFISIGD